MARNRTGIAFLTALTLWSCARNPVTGKKELMLVSEPQEIQMGRQAAQQIPLELGLVEDWEIGQRVAQFRRGLELLQALKAAAPQWKLVARVCSPRSNGVEPLYFSVDVHRSGVSLHRTSAEGFVDGAILVPRGVSSTDAGV